MALLPNPATLSYNGITFNSTQEVFASKKFIPDSSGRTIAKTVLTLKVKAIVADGANQNATMAAMQAALERPGCALTYTGMAFGGLSVNTPGGKRDLEWGPTPRILNWKPVGRDQAAEIEWQVDVTLIGCPDAPDRNAVMEANYELDFSVNTSGLTTRTISGFVKIPMTRNGANNPNIPDNIEEYIDDFVPPLIPRFDRTSSRTLNEAKNEAKFRFIDTERAGNALPKGVLNASASHRFTSDRGAVFVRWNGTIDASYEIMPGFPRYKTGWDAFMELVEDRVKEERKQGSMCFPVQMTIGEPEIYGTQSASFSFAYMAMNENLPKNLSYFPNSALGRAVPNSDWNRWLISIANARNLRGLAGLRYNAQNDAMVDLCFNRIPAKLVAVGNPLKEQPKQVKERFAEVRRRLGLKDNPNPRVTWLHYQCAIEIEEESHMVAHFPLPSQPMPGESRLRTPAFDGFPQLGHSRMFAQQTTPPPIVQHRTSPGYHIRFIGKAMRYAYGIPAPDVVRVAGSPVVDANDPELGTYWRQSLVSWTTHPIYAASWNLRYFVARGAGAAPGPAPYYPHPFGE